MGLGALKALPFGGLCNPCSNISDRFYLGGPLNLRGEGEAGEEVRTWGARSEATKRCEYCAFCTSSSLRSSPLCSERKYRRLTLMSRERAFSARRFGPTVGPLVLTLARSPRLIVRAAPTGFGQSGVGPRSDPRGPGADGGDTLGGEVRGAETGGFVVPPPFVTHLIAPFLTSRLLAFALEQTAVPRVVASAVYAFPPPRSRR